MTDQWTPSDEPTPPTLAHVNARTRLRRGEIARIGVVIASLVVLVAAAAVTIGATPGTSLAPVGAGPSGSPSASGDQKRPGPDGLRGLLGGRGGLGGFFFGGPSAGSKLGDRIGSFGRAITITKIDGSNVSLKTDDGWTRTIAVTDTTQIRIGSQAGKLADLNVDDVVALSEKKNADGTFTITLIVVRVPTVAGIVTDVSADGFTIKQRDGSSKTVTVSSSTDYLLGSAKSSKSDISVGARVQVEGANGSGTSFSAKVVRIVPDVRFGKVTATTGSTITIDARGGTSVTIHVDASTTYKVLGTATAKLSDVTVGMVITAQGISRADGSLDASSVVAGAVRGPKSLPIRPDASPPAS